MYVFPTPYLPNFLYISWSKKLSFLVGYSYILEIFYIIYFAELLIYILKYIQSILHWTYNIWHILILKFSFRNDLRNVLLLYSALNVRHSCIRINLFPWIVLNDMIIYSSWFASIFIKRNVNHSYTEAGWRWQILRDFSREWHVHNRDCESVFVVETTLLTHEWSPRDKSHRRSDLREIHRALRYVLLPSSLAHGVWRKTMKYNNEM